jgi:hypothetical protein
MREINDLHNLRISYLESNKPEGYHSHLLYITHTLTIAHTLTTPTTTPNTPIIGCIYTYTYVYTHFNISL